MYHTAGALGQGERVWILAKLPGDIRVIGDDIASKFLLLSNSHDGQGSVQIKFTPIRVVCQNTLTQALKDGPTVRVPHFRNLEERLRFARRTLGLLDRRFSSLGESFQAMVRVHLDTTGVKDYFSKVFPHPVNPENRRAVAKADENRLWSLYFFENGKGNQLSGVGSTLWAAYNSVAELVDHRGSKNGSKDRHLQSVWFGEGYLTKARAYKLAMRTVLSQIS